MQACIRDVANCTIMPAYHHNATRNSTKNLITPVHCRRPHSHHDSASRRHTWPWLEVITFEPIVLILARTLIQTLTPAGATVAGPVPLPNRRRIYTVLRSPHVNKDSREQFQIITHSRLLDVKNLSAQVRSCSENRCEATEWASA